MKRPCYIAKDNAMKKTLQAGLKYVYEKQPKRFHYPERSRKILTEEYKKFSLV